MKAYIGELGAPSNNPDAMFKGIGGSAATVGGPTWQRVLRWCPRELVDLVNSKACRGAIMFNDALSLERCERLVRELADAAIRIKDENGLEVMQGAFRHYHVAITQTPH